MSSNTEIADLEMQVFELTAKLQKLRQENETVEVPNYSFQTQAGDTTLLNLFADRDKLLMIHNMGQGCRYCTLWADGFNGFVPHLESAMSVVLVSKDTPDLQRRFANSRNWRFQLASHGASKYLDEQSVAPNAGNMPGAVFYERQGDKILRKNACAFGPGDIYCSMWSLLGLGGMGAGDWTPQYNYWKRPEKLDDGGDNVLN